MIISFSTKQRCNGISLLSLLIGLAVGSIALSAILSMYKNTAQISVQQAQQSKQNSQQEAGALAAQMELQQAGFNLLSSNKLAIFRKDSGTNTAPDLIVLKNASLSANSTTASGKKTYYYTVTGSNPSGGYYELLAADQTATTPTTYTNFAIFWRYNTSYNLTPCDEANPTTCECRGLIAQNIGLTLLTPTSSSPTCTSAYDAAQTSNPLQWQATELVSENPPANMNWDDATIRTIRTKIALSVSDSSKGTGACWPFGTTDPSSALIDTTATQATTSVSVPEITIWLNNGYSLFSGDPNSSMMQSFTTCLPNFANTNTIIPSN